MNEQLNNGWQPMDTAPKDMRILLINEPGAVYACHYVQNIETGEEAWMVMILDDNHSVLLNDPVAWHELPEPPELTVLASNVGKEVH